MDKEIIDKFLRNECTQEEEQMVYEYLLNSDDEESILMISQSVWNNPEESAEIAGSKTRLFQEIVDDIRNEREVPVVSINQNVESVKSPEKRVRVSKKWLSVAAVVLIALGISYTLFDLNPPVEVPVAATSNIEKVNSSGHRSKIVMRDGTKIFLNAESKISYSDEKYGVELREIYLEGEAYFEVAKNADIPFIVKTKKLSTTALGTAFNVRAFNDENSSQVSLAEGKVKVSRIDGDTPNSDENIFLMPDEEIQLNEDNLIKRKFDTDRVLSWKDGIIYFKETGFTDAVRVLERWYNVKFEINNIKDISSLKGTGTFKNESLENVLKALSYSLQFKYTIDDNTVNINF
ncbi:FecR domain-containing protein [Reichenbachiella sp. MALMAid0571]|uniref:FecR family protein n=1 Tax=Reichenbachiella sp. MALMAid0571 TaxID=3143939 RepID=UPI0032E048CB